MPTAVASKLERIARDMAIDPEYFTAWEREFVESLEAQAGGYTARQLQTLEALYEKANKR